MPPSQHRVEKIILAEPRGFCAGVDRAVEAVRGALRTYGRPLYVRHQIVHNRFVLEALEEEGAIFVEDLDEVPEGQRVIFSAHGVAPSEWERARERRLRVIDATCPLVTKVHLEVERYAREDRSVILVGHAGHEEVKGTLGVAPGRVLLVGSVEEAEATEVPDPQRVAAVTQTTLSVDDTREIMATLKRRFPAMVDAQDRRHLLRDPESPERGQGVGRAVATLFWWSAPSRAPTPIVWSRSPGCAARALS